MAHLHITDTSPHAIGATGGFTLRTMISVGTGFTGTITVADFVGTVAVITNPVIGNSFQYWDLQGVVTVTSSATGDITVNTSSTYGNR